MTRGRARPTRRAAVALTAAIAVAGALAWIAPAAGGAPARAAAAEASVYRMNAGGPAVTDSIGRVWRADEYVTGGGSHTVTDTIAGTDDQALFRSERWGMTSYDIPIANGSYTLQLLLAELNPSSGRRVFSVTAGGRPYLTDYTIADHVGNFRALVTRGTVAVTDGVLHLRFTSTLNSASVTGIELLSADSPAPTPTVSPTVPPPPTSPSGEPMPAAAPPGWSRVFAEDFPTDVALGGFAASSYQDKWSWYPTSYHDTSGNGTYNPAIVSVAGGVLTKNLRTSGGRAQVAALLPRLTGTGDGRLYGRYTVRFRADAVPGYKVAWLQWPDSEDWDDGEIDFPEGDLTDTIGGFSHCADIGHPERNCLAYDSGLSFDGWHTATQEWTAGRVTFFLDGRQVATTTTNVPRHPMHWVLQTETQLGGGAPPAGATGKVQIDWVTVDVPA